MSELGNLLKKAREEQGLTLDDVQEHTKIRKRYLEALEEGDYKVLPGKFYIRAFIKNYAEFVGLDSEEVLKHYHIDEPEIEVPVNETVPPRRPRKIRSARSERFGKLGFTILLWAFLIIVIWVIWYFNVNRDTPPADETDPTAITDNRDVTATPTPTKNTAASTPTPTPTPTPPPVELTLSSSSGSEMVYTVASTKDSYELKVNNSGEASWLEIYEGGKKGTRLYYASIKDGESLSFTVSKDVYLNIGRPANIEVTLDDIVVDDGDSNKGRRGILLQMQGANTTAE